jgi:hypothetical protein
MLGAPLDTVTLNDVDPAALAPLLGEFFGERT